MRCPICKKELENNKYKPFCSKRCADLDLGNWFNEKYSFEAQEIEQEDIKELENLVNNNPQPE